MLKIPAAGVTIIERTIALPAAIGALTAPARTEGVRLGEFVDACVGDTGYSCTEDLSTAYPGPDIELRRGVPGRPGYSDEVRLLHEADDIGSFDYYAEVPG